MHVVSGLHLQENTWNLYSWIIDFMPCIIIKKIEDDCNIFWMFLNSFFKIEMRVVLNCVDIFSASKQPLIFSSIPLHK